MIQVSIYLRGEGSQHPYTCSMDEDVWRKLKSDWESGKRGGIYACQKLAGKTGETVINFAEVAIIDTL